MNPTSDERLASYVPRPGVSIPLVTILDAQGRVLEEEQRALVRFTIQDGLGADVLFAVGTTGEWNRLDNPRRQQAARIILDECRRRSPVARPVEAWIGITAHTRAETLENLEHSLECGADAAVLAPLSIIDADDPVDFAEREIGAVFERAGRMLPVFLYDNADIAAPGRMPHLHTRDVKRMSRLPYIRGIKVTASKSVLGNYTRAASHFKPAHEFAIYVGDPLLIFELFAPAVGIAGIARDRWNRYLTRHSLPYGVVAGPANVMPREWQRAWQVCCMRDLGLMNRYRAVLAEFQDACSFLRAGTPYRPMLACFKAALAESGVVRSDAVAPGTPALTAVERREFARRLAELRAKWARVLEPGWTSEYHAAAGGSLAREHG